MSCYRKFKIFQAILLLTLCLNRGVWAQSWDVKISHIKIDNEPAEEAFRIVLEKCKAEHPKIKFPSRVVTVDRQGPNSTVSMELTDAPLLDAIEAIAEAGGYSFEWTSKELRLIAWGTGRNSTVWSTFSVDFPGLIDHFGIDESMSRGNASAKDVFLKRLYIPAKDITWIEYSKDEKAIIVVGRQEAVMLLKAAFTYWERGVELKSKD